MNDRLAVFSGFLPKLEQAAGVIRKVQIESRSASPVRNPGITRKPETPAVAASTRSIQKNEREHISAGQPLAKAQRLILAALVQHGQASKSKVAVLTQYAVNGGGFNNALSSLRSQGYLDGRGDLLEATPLGAEVLGPVDPLPSGEQLIQQWCRDLPKAESSILRYLCEEYPNARSKEQVAAAVGYEPSGGGFNNALSKLRTLELIDGRGELRASDSLFS